MSKARIEAEVTGAEEGARKLSQIKQALIKLNAAHRDGKISTNQLRKSTAALERMQAKLTKSTKASRTPFVRARPP